MFGNLACRQRSNDIVDTEHVKHSLSLEQKRKKKSYIVLHMKAAEHSSLQYMACCTMNTKHIAILHFPSNGKT